MSEEELRNLLIEIYKEYSGEAENIFSVNPLIVQTKLTLNLPINFVNAVTASPFALYKRGIGKSVYCLKALEKIYDNREDALNHVVFLPREFLSLLKRAIDNNKRILLLVWDDAGVWVGASRFTSNFVKAIRECLNVIRTHVAVLTFTTPSERELARGIRVNLDTLHIINLDKWSKNPRNVWSRVSFYQHALYLASRKKYRFSPEPLLRWRFKNWLDWYSEYDKIREGYLRRSFIKAKEALLEIEGKERKKLEEELKAYYDEEAEALRELSYSVVDRDVSDLTPEREEIELEAEDEED